VEIPAVAVHAEQFTAEVDFFSIGTNDLTQYALAAERGNPRLAALSEALQPAVLRLVEQIITAAHVHGKSAAKLFECGSRPKRYEVGITDSIKACPADLDTI